MTAIDKMFIGCAALGGGLFVLRMALFAIGGMGGDADVGTDVDAEVDADVDVSGHFDVHGDVHGGFDAGGHADTGHVLADSSAIFRMVSIMSITAFFMMFGLVGLALRKETGSGEALAIIGALAAGVGSFWLIAKLIALLRRLQSSGNVHLANAIGQEGAIYLTIPAGGVGKVEAVVQERMKYVDATARDGRAIPTGERVAIVGVGPDNTLVVERIGQAK
jgi:hypothetical protein